MIQIAEVSVSKDKNLLGKFYSYFLFPVLAIQAKKKRKNPKKSKLKEGARENRGERATGGGGRDEARSYHSR